MHMKNELTTTKKVVAKSNSKKVNQSLVTFVENINATDNNGNLLLGTKNTMRETLAKLGYFVNGKSTDYRPLDAYTRFNSGVQFQLLYSNKTKTFNGFNIRLTDKSQVDKFNYLNTIFTSCNDNARILKSDKITDFSLLPQTIEILANL